jgi:hypothetical protein
MNLEDQFLDLSDNLNLVTQIAQTLRLVPRLADHSTLHAPITTIMFVKN